MTPAQVEAMMTRVIDARLQHTLPRMLSALLNGQSNAALPNAADFPVLIDGRGVQGWMQAAVTAGRTGNPNANFPRPNG